MGTVRKRYLRMEEPGLWVLRRCRGQSLGVLGLGVPSGMHAGMRSRPLTLTSLICYGFA